MAVRSRLWRDALAVSVLVFTSHTALGQTTGSISGRVTDPTGERLPGVTVEATSERLQGARTTVTSRDGVYRFPAVPPGPYRLRAGLPGFRWAERTATVSLDTTATVDLALQLSTEEQVVVSGETLVDSASTTTGTNYRSQVVSRLPVSRNYADVVRLNPGVSFDRGKTQGRVLALTIEGSTSAENLWLIEGINTSDVVYGIQGKLLNEEFVQEVQVKTGGYQAEYGGALGGVINVVTKSGGNTFHGGAFAYFDSGATRAQPIYVPGEDFPSDQKTTPGNQFDLGANLGGFLLKNRLWFFGVYNRVHAPSTITSREAPASPDRFPVDQTRTLYGAKLTGNISSRTTLVGTIFADPSLSEGAACGDPVNSADPGTWQCQRSYGGLDAALRLDQLVGSRVFATLQASRHRDSFELVGTGAGGAVRFEDRTCEGGTPELPCEPADPPNQRAGGLGLISGPGDNARSKRLQYGGSATFYAGNHELRAGGQYQDLEQVAVTFYTGAQTVTYLNQYGQNYYQHDFFARSREDLTPVDVPTRPEARRLGFYAQDSFRATPNLTIHAGLRWDQDTLKEPSGATIFKTSNEWQPRLGVVWDPWKDGVTRVYASAGRFYYALPLDLASLAYGHLIEATTFNFSPVDLTPDPSVTNRPPQEPRGSDFGDPVDEGLKGIYQDEFTIGIERALTPTLSVGVKGRYRSLGRTIEDRCDLDYNAPVNNGSSCAIMNPGSSGRFARGNVPTCNGLDEPFHECSETGAATVAARRLYRGIEILVKESVGDSLWLQASYVYSSLRGNYDGIVSSFGQTNPGLLIDFDYPQYFRNTYGALALDHPHQARLDLTYTFPFRTFVGLGAYVQSGAPRNRLGSVHAYQPFIAPVFLIPRGSGERLPTLWEADLTVGYPFSIGPVVVTAQVYLFNLFNNQFPTYRNPVYRRFTVNPPGYPDTIYDADVPADYLAGNRDKIQGRQDPRLFRASLRVSF